MKLREGNGRFPTTFWTENKLLIGLVLLKLLLHLFTGWQYGYFRDELYYFAMSEHPDFGYLDVSPLVPHLMRFSRLLFGDSVVAIHIFPALAGALAVWLTGLITKKLGGGRFAQVLAAVAIGAAPLFQVFNSMFTYDCFDQLMSAVFIYSLIGALKEEQPSKRWLVVGLVAGIGLMVKISLMFLVFSVMVGLLFTPARRAYVSKWPWLGAGIALLICLPYLIWQGIHGFPIVEYWGNYAGNISYRAKPLEFIGMQMVVLNPVVLPIWLAGLGFYFVSKAGKPYRSLGWMYLVYLTLAIWMAFKFYILSGVYFALVPGGAIMVERFGLSPAWRWSKPVYTTVIFLVGLAVLPINVPVFPVTTFMQYSQVVNSGQSSVKAENLDTGGLPQQFADRFGWEELARTVAGVYKTLEPNEQRHCAIYAENYGEAGAIDLLGRQYGLPKSISSHLSYYIWGPRDYTGECMIVVGYGRDYRPRLEALFGEVKEAAFFHAQYAIPHENNKPVFICRKLKVPLKQLWPRIKILG